MKNIKLFMLASLIAVVLVAGQPHATVASPNSNIGLSGFDSETMDWSVEITSVVAEVGGDPLEVADDGTYHVETDAFAPTVRVKADISGMTTIQNETGHDIDVVGKLYLIVNGETIVAPASIVGTTGFDVTVPETENSITLLYVGWNTTGIVYAQDTAVVRVSDDAADFDAVPYESVEIPVEVTATDNAVEAIEEEETYNTTGIITASGRDVIFEPTEDLDLGYRSGDGTQGDLSEGNYNNIVLSQYGTFTVQGTFDSSGFKGSQLNTSVLHDKVMGDMFAIGGEGVELVNFETTGFFTRTRSGSANVTVGSTTAEGKTATAFGVLVLAPYGYWESTTHHFGLTSAGNGMADFTETGVSAQLLAQSPTGFNVQTERSPGFGAVVTLISVGAIAYVAPRLRKD